LLSPVLSSLLFACCCVFLARSLVLSLLSLFHCFLFYTSTVFVIAEKNYSCLALVSVAAGLGFGALLCYVV
jgi:hypothetical protein